MLQLKQALLKLCHQFIDERIANCNLAIDTANASISEDTKSSAGDKYETSREMITQEIKNVTAQKEDALREKQALHKLHIEISHSTIKPGSLTFTNHGMFFIAISAGVLKHEAYSAIAVSPSSPIGKVLLAKKVGSTFTFNEREYEVREIY